jgi:hypothetical protein
MDSGKSKKTKVKHPTLGTVKIKPHPGKSADRAKFAKGGK